MCSEFAISRSDHFDFSGKGWIIHTVVTAELHHGTISIKWCSSAVGWCKFSLFQTLSVAKVETDNNFRIMLEGIFQLEGRKAVEEFLEMNGNQIRTSKALQDAREGNYLVKFRCYNGLRYWLFTSRPWYQETPKIRKPLNRKLPKKVNSEIRKPKYSHFFWQIIQLDWLEHYCQYRRRMGTVGKMEFGPGNLYR